MAIHEYFLRSDEAYDMCIMNDENVKFSATSKFRGGIMIK